jgi:hypothetical protein
MLPAIAGDKKPVLHTKDAVKSSLTRSRDGMGVLLSSTTCKVVPSSSMASEISLACLDIPVPTASQTKRQSKVISTSCGVGTLWHATVLVGLELAPSFRQGYTYIRMIGVVAYLVPVAMQNNNGRLRTMMGIMDGFLAICADEKPTCLLTLNPDGVWRGKWLEYEMNNVELAEVKEPSQCLI